MRTGFQFANWNITVLCVDAIVTGLNLTVVLNEDINLQSVTVPLVNHKPLAGRLLLKVVYCSE